MKSTFVFITALLIMGTIQAQNKIKGNGQVTSINRSVGSYDKVQFSGSFDYILVAGKEGEISLNGEENLLPYIITEVKGNELIVRIKNKTRLQTSFNKTIKIKVPVENITSVSLSGSGDVWNESSINANQLEISLTGSGDIKLNVDTKNLKTNLTGSGDIILKGKTENLTVNVTGSGDFHGYDIISNNSKISVNGSGSAKTHALEKIEARVAGSGSITYKGNPQNEDTKVSGSGSIKKN